VQLSQAHRPKGPPRIFGLKLRDSSAPVRLRSVATRTSGVTTSLGLARATGLPCGSPRRATRDASDRRLLPNTFTTSTRASGVFRAVERLRRERRFTTPRLASAGEKDQRGGAFSSPRRASHRASGAPVAPRARPACLVRRSRASSERQDRFGLTPRERHAAPATRSTFRRWVPSSSRRPFDRLRPRATELDVRRSRDFAITLRLSAFLHAHALATMSSRRSRLARGR